MTDNTQPAAGSTHIIRYALEMGLLWIDGDGRDKVREALDALDTLEAPLASIGACGVSALMGAARKRGVTSKNLLQVQAWAIPDGDGGGQFSWQKQDERYWTRLTTPAQADSVLYDPKAVLDVFNSARAGSEKPVGYLRGILAVIAHWESRPEPHRWMVPVRADSVQEDLLDAAFEAVRKRLCGVQRYSFVLEDDGLVRRVRDRAGSWIEFDEAHALLDPMAVDAARKQVTTP